MRRLAIACMIFMLGMEDGFGRIFSFEEGFFQAQGSLEWNEGEGVVIGRDDVLFRTKDVSLRAEEVILYRDGDEFKRLEVRGEVRILSNGYRLEGDSGFYDAAEKVLKIFGSNLRMVTPRSVILRAKESFEFYEEEGLFVARGEASVTDRGRVLRSSTLIGRVGLETLERVDALGGVEVEFAEEGWLARGDRGVYLILTEKAVVLRRVFVMRRGDEIRGDRMEIDFKTGVGKISSTSGLPVRGVVRR